MLDNKVIVVTDLEKISCNLCGSIENKLRFKKNGNLTDYMFHIVECSCCGLVLVNSRLKSDAIDALYDEEYFRGGGFDASVDYVQEVEQGCSGSEIRAFNRISSIIPEASSVLEVGPGMGLLLKKMQDAGHYVQGLDISDFVVEELSNQGIEMLRGDLRHASIPAKSYDAVIAIEVIEHLPDPMSFFKEVRRILKPSGLFYFETGDITCEEAIHKGAAWDYIMPEGHLYYFSPKTIHSYCRKVGLSALYPAWYSPERSVVKLLKKLGLLGDGQLFDLGWRGKLSRCLSMGLDTVLSRKPFPMVKKKIYDWS